VKLLHFEQGGLCHPGVLVDDRVLDLVLAWRDTELPPPTTLNQIIWRQSEYLPAIRELIAEARQSGRYLLDAEELKPAPAVPSPGKIVCVGVNYRKHAIEAGQEVPQYPVLFSKFSNAIAAPDQVVDISGLSRVDYEAELAVVIGRTPRRVAPADALGRVFGYCNANDLSDRELQVRSGQWLLGKTIDDFLPVGPWLVTSDEVPDPQNLRIRGWLNGELRQDSNTADMIFSVAEIIAYASTYFTLEAGDLIITGTPAGVIMGMEDPQWLRNGDEYTVEVEGLGRLTNRLTA